MNLKLLGILGGIVLAAVLLWPSGSSQKVKTLFEEGEQLYQAKKYQDAIAKYQEAIAESKKKFVDTSIIDKDFESLAKYKTALAYAELAKQTEDVTLYDKSLEYVQDVYQKATVKKHKAAIVFLWGHVLYQQEKYEEAEPKFKELIEFYPESQFVENAYYMIGKLNFALARYEPSRLGFKAVMDSFPNSQFIDDAQYLIAQSYLVEGNYEQAFTEFDKMTPEKFPNHPELVDEAQYKAAYSLVQLGRNDEAIAKYNAFIANFPNSRYVTAAYFDIGTIYTKLKNYDQARQNYELAIQNTKDEALQAEIQFEIGENYFDQEDYDNAVASYQKLIENYPNSKLVGDSRFAIGESYMKKKDYDNAIKAYQEVLDKHSDSRFVAHSTFQIGEAYFQKKEYQTSLSWYQKVLDKYADQSIATDALYGAIWCLGELGRSDEVQKLGTEFIAKMRQDPKYDLAAAEVQMKLGDIQFDMEHYDQAAIEYGKVINDYKDLPKFNALKCRSRFQEGFSYFKAAEKKNMEAETLKKAVNPYKDLIDRFSDLDLPWRSKPKFNVAEYDFQGRAALIENSIFNLALTHEKLQEWANARIAYNLILKASENYGRAKVLAAETFISEGKKDEAIKAYGAIVKDASYGPTWQSLAAIKEADLLRDTGQFVEAASAYENIVKTYPKSEYVDSAQYLVGLCWYQAEPKTKENMQKSIAAFQKLLDTYSQSKIRSDTSYGIVLAYKEMEDWDKVLELCDQIVSTYSNSKEERDQKVVNSSNLMKIVALERKGSGAKASDELIASLRRVVDSPVADEQTKAASQLKIGNLYFNSNRYQEAIAEYDKLSKLFPASDSVLPAYYQTSVAAYRIEDYNGAVQAANKALERNPDPDMKANILYSQGLNYFKLNKHSEAAKAYKAAIALENQVKNDQTRTVLDAAHTELARALTELKDYQGSVEEYKYIAAHSPEKSVQANAYFWLATTLDDQLKQYKEAIEGYQKALELFEDPPMQAQCYYRIGLIYSAKAKDTDKGIQTFETLMAKFSDSSDRHIQTMVVDAGVRQSELYLETKRIGEAIRKAQDIRDKALKGTDLIQKAQAQYQLAYVLAIQAKDAFGAPDYMAKVRTAASAYNEVAKLAAPLDSMPEEVKVFVAPSLFQAGQLWQALKEKQDYQNAIPALENYIKYFPTDDANQMVTAMTYLGSSYYELALRSEGDANLFVKSSEAFQDLAKRFPTDKEADLAQYQAGESLFAAKKFKEAIPVYRVVVQKYRNSEYAPESLNAMAACYSYMADELKEPAAKLKLLDQVYDTYEELVKGYPKSKYAIDAYINLGNNYYNQGSVATVSQKERERLYGLAIENYEKAAAATSIDEAKKKEVQGYIKETEEILANEIYVRGYKLMDQAKSASGPADKRTKSQDAVKIFDEVIKKYPRTDAADLCYIQIGGAYELLADLTKSEDDWTKARDAYDQLIKKYTDSKGNEIRPGSDNVVQGLKFAKQRQAQIISYLTQLEIHKKSTAGKGGQ